MGTKSKTAVATKYSADAERDEATAARLEAEGDHENAAHYRAAARHCREKASFSLAREEPTSIVMGEAAHKGTAIL